MVGVVFFGFFATVFCSVGLIILGVQLTRRKGAVRIPARVVHYLVESMTRTTTKGYVAVFEATLPDGRTARLESQERRTEKRWPEGTSVELLYLPGNEGEPLIEKANRIIPIVFCTIGVLATFATIATYADVRSTTSTSAPPPAASAR